MENSCSKDHRRQVNEENVKTKITKNIPRASWRNKKECWEISLLYCKVEFLMLKTWLGSAALSLVVSNFSNHFFESNEYQLPLKYYIIWFPLDGSSLNWSLNYAYQLINSCFASAFYYVYTPMTLLLINQSCLLVDILSLRVKELHVTVGGDDKNASIESSRRRNIAQNNLITELLRDIIEIVNNIQKWQSDVQNLLRFNFLVEFQYVSFIICVCVYTVSIVGFGSVIVLSMLFIFLSQLFVFCWMGSRLKAKVDELSDDFFYVRWYLVDIKHQKDVKFVLMMLQNIKGFNGIFKTLDLRTFQKV